MGGDPLAEKRHGQGVPTVEKAAAEVLAILTPIWHEKSQTAQRVRQRISAVMKWAIAMGYRPDNPAGDALGRQQTVVQHMRALPHGAVADALATVRASQASVTTKRAFEFLVLTAARSGEVRLATWDEMDLNAGVWAIPAARMKAKRDHRVPLSGRALAILHDVPRLSDGTGLVFRSLRGKPLSTVTLPRLTKELGIAAVPHGFRSSFRDWAAEQTNTPREVVEAALAHTVQNPTEAWRSPAAVGAVARSRGSARHSRPAPGSRTHPSGARRRVSYPVLLDQPSIRDPNVTVAQLVAETSAKTGENITVARFARYLVGAGND